MQNGFLSGTVCVVLAILLGSAPQTGSAAQDADQIGRDVPLRVATYNMHTGIGAAGRLDLAGTARTLEDLDADVIGLQEVDVHWSARSAWR
ncbi:MAG: endonuclease/exonuclease/phosphatase family protein, partial [Thermoleophilaceae bacterium]